MSMLLKPCVPHDLLDIISINNTCKDNTQVSSAILSVHEELSMEHTIWNVKYRKAL